MLPSSARWTAMLGLTLALPTSSAAQDRSVPTRADTPTPCSAGQPVRCPDGTCVSARLYCPLPSGQVGTVDPSAADPGRPGAESGHLHGSQVIHRDVAARSGGGSDGSTKAQDYNSSRSNRPRTEARPRDRDDVGPIRWMAPESVRDAGRRTAAPAAAATRQGALSWTRVDALPSGDPSMGAAMVARLGLPSGTPVIMGAVGTQARGARARGSGGAWTFRESRSYALSPIRGTVDNAPEEKERGAAPLTGATVAVGRLEPAQGGRARSGSWHIELEIDARALAGPEAQLLRDAFQRVTVSVSRTNGGRPAAARRGATGTHRGAGPEVEFPEWLEIRGVSLLRRGPGNPLHEESTAEGTNPLYEGQAAPGGNNGTSAPELTLHLDLHISDPDSDEDGYGDVLRNLTFGVSARPVRGGR